MLEDYIRNEEAINSTQSRIQDIYIYIVFDNFFLYACTSTQKSRASIKLGVLFQLSPEK